MTQSVDERQKKSRARVLVLSMLFAPCDGVGGKRFANLSRYLTSYCEEYHVLARREKRSFSDPTEFHGNVHRVSMFPYFPPLVNRGIRKKLAQAWFRWLCLVDQDVGWVIPAILKGVVLCRKHQLNVVIVTAPPFSSLAAAAIISKIANARLIIDYRDPWTNHIKSFRKPLGKWLSRTIERRAIKRASGIVVCTNIMRDMFVKAFGEIMPPRLEVIYNAFDDFEKDPKVPHVNERITMTYGGTFHGTRRLSVIATVLAEMLGAGEFSEDNFRLMLYAQLNAEDYSLIDRLGIGGLVEVHEPLPYQVFKVAMLESDILFLPSGTEVAYAVPFKFFDYLSVRRPILAVAPKQSSVSELMQLIDCGEFAEYGEHNSIRGALKTLIQKERTYTFRGSERFRWESAAKKYISIIDATAECNAAGC